MAAPIFDHEKLDVYRLAMLTRLAIRSDRVSESPEWYEADTDYDYEHRFAEQE